MCLHKNSKNQNRCQFSWDVSTEHVCPRAIQLREENKEIYSLFRNKKYYGLYKELTPTTNLNFLYLKWIFFHLFYHNLQGVSIPFLGEYSYSLPGSVVTYNNSSNSYSAQGLTFTPIEEGLKWRITYTGPLR